MANYTPTPPSPAIVESLQRTCRAIFAEGQVTELRALGLNGRDGHCSSGWFDSVEALVESAIAIEAQQPEGIYITLNPVNPACLARSPNKLKPFLRVTTSDKEIVSRHWLPIDLDPVRPSKISSSASELEAARIKAKEITAWLENERGWPRGLRAFSSNGIHLLYRIDLPNDDDAKETIHRCIKAISKKFSDGSVKVDETVFNASRIWKLWGTISRKGASVPDRPHRRSFLWPGADEDYQSFADVIALTSEQIDSLALLCTDTKKGKGRSTTSLIAASKHVRDIDLNAFIAKHNIEVTRSESWDGTGWRHILAHCIFDPSHTGSGAVLGKSPTGAVFYKCQHDSCASKKWADVRDHFEPRRKGEKSQDGDDKDGSRTTSPSSPRAATDNAWELARDFIRDCYQTPEGDVLLRRHRESFYTYRPELGIFEELSLDAIRTQITIWASEYLEKTTVRAVNDVLHSIGANVTVPDTKDLPVWSEVELGELQPFSRVNMQPRRWIAMSNGILDVDRLLTGKPAEECIEQPSSKWVNTIKLEYPFDITARCDLWQKFLNEIMEDDEERIAVIQEAFGYCLWDSTELERFFILVGSGQNGKSTAMNILESLLGRPNVSFLSPSEIEDRFLRIGLYGKIANICTDMDDVDKFSEKMIKKICSGETIIADRKFRNSLNWKPRVKLFFATNILPRFVDITQGIWRRATIIPFDVQIPDEKKDTRLIHKLRGELPGIFLWAVQGMIRLLKNREFTRSVECERTHREYRRQCFPILTFLDEETEFNEDASSRIDEVYGAYTAWCKEHGLTKPKPLHMFARDVYEFRPTIRRERRRDDDGEKRVMLMGLKLKQFALRTT